MKKTLIFAALPLAIGLAACDSASEPDESPAIDTSDNELTTDPSVVPPTDTDPGPSALPEEPLDQPMEDPDDSAESPELPETNY